jgi:acyl-coenzyme A synthetase/AMP-(fatty) acid ligase
MLIDRVGVTKIITDQKIDITGKDIVFVMLPVRTSLTDEVKIDNLKNFSSKPAKIYLNTSGSTGDMNIILFTEDQIALQAERHKHYAEERYLRLATVQYNTSKRHRLYSLWNGGTNIMRPEGTLLHVANFALEQKVSCIDISRMHVTDLMELGKKNIFSQMKLRPGGGEVPAYLRKLFRERVTQQLFVRYATTETGAIAMSQPAPEDNDSCGKPLPGVIVEIVDENGQLMSAGELGEIRIKSQGMAVGYFDRPKESKNRFKDGWFYPGDIGYFYKDGRLVVEGRKDDMINLNGIKIFPAEIERVLEKHPAVKVAACFPVESAIHGQIPVAAVEVREGFDVTESELQLSIRKQLSVRAPRKIMILPQLLRDGQGKLQRREMKKKFLERRSRK